MQLKTMSNILQPQLSKDLILLVLFVCYFDFGTLIPEPKLQVLEFFAGIGRIARFAHRTGYKARAFDITYDQEHKNRPRASTYTQRNKRSYMDINGAAGFALLSQDYPHLPLNGPFSKLNPELEGASLVLVLGV